MRLRDLVRQYRVLASSIRDFVFANPGHVWHDSVPGNNPGFPAYSAIFFLTGRFTCHAARIFITVFLAGPVTRIRNKKLFAMTTLSFEDTIHSHYASLSCRLISVNTRFRAKQWYEGVHKDLKKQACISKWRRFKPNFRCSGPVSEWEYYYYSECCGLHGWFHCDSRTHNLI